MSAPSDAPPRALPPVTERDHAVGPPDAAATLVVYANYECLHCRRAYPALEALRAELGDRLRFVAWGRGSDAMLETPRYGADPDGGFFARPAIFSDVRPDNRLAQEEIFGPILSFLTVGGYDEAVEVVNGTPYGLSSGIATTSMATAMAFARDARTGLVKVNQPTTGMAMNAPFGGMGRSSTQTHKEQAGASMMAFYTHDKTTYFSA